MEPAVCPYVHYSTSLQVYVYSLYKEHVLVKRNWDCLTTNLLIFFLCMATLWIKKNIKIMVYISSQNININVFLLQNFQLYVCTVFKIKLKINYFSLLSVVWYKQRMCTQCLRYCLRFFKSFLSTLWVRTRLTYSHLTVPLFITI